MDRKGGQKRKTRKKLRKPLNRKGKISLTDYLRKYKEGDKVVLLPEPSVNKGMPFRRFFGKSATIKSKIGQCYEVVVRDNNKEKTIVVHPVHLKKSG